VFKESNLTRQPLPSKRQSALSRASHLLTAPAPTVREPEARQQAQFLAVAVLAVGPVGILAVILVALLGGDKGASLTPLFEVALIGISIGTVAYFLSRTRYYRMSGLLVLSIVYVAILLLLLTSSNIQRMDSAYYLIMAVILSSVLFPLRFTLVTFLVISTTLLIAALAWPSMLWLMVRPLFFNVLASALVLVVALYRNQLERGRQAELQIHRTNLQWALDDLEIRVEERTRELWKAREELEQRVQERTAELTEVNQRLRAEIGERQKAEEQLAYQANLLQNVSDAIISTDAQFVIRSWNKAAERIYGWTEAEMLNRSMLALQPRYVDGSSNETVTAAFLTKGFWEGEVEQTHKDGSTLNLWSSVTLLKDVSGSPIGSVGVNRDMTERKRAEAAEQEQRALAEALRETAAAINSTLDLDEVLDRILDQLQKVMPHDAANVMFVEGDTIHIVRHHGYVERGMSAETFESLRIPYSRIIDGRIMKETGRPRALLRPLEHPGWIHLQGAEWIRCAISAPIIIRGQLIGLLNMDNKDECVFTAADSDRFQAFAQQVGIAISNAAMFDSIRNQATEMENRVIERTIELERERAQLQTILDSMNEGVLGIIFDADLQPKSRYVNQALTRLMGYTRDEWNIDLLQSVSASDEEILKLQKSFFATLAAGHVWRVEAKLRRRDGSEFDAEVTATRINGRDGRMVGIVTVVRDVSQEKALQEQKSRFVANASHELRTPITNLITRLYLLRKKPEQLDTHLEILDYVANRMRNLVEDLLDFSRFERGIIPLNPRTINLAELISQIMRAQEAEADLKAIRLICDLPPHRVQVNADPERLTQVITNLVINAINYTPEGGTVQVGVEEAQESVSVMVKDSGPGIPSEHLPYIFQPFYRVTENSKGTGLGLSIAKEIIDRHGGSIEARSDPGGGSTFIITLPLRPEPAGSGAQATSG
jgi:PAS domain S-box-containing protein